ncbi:response regulator transcription factor [Microaerobacter geothermalis]|uniref:response regulator transcription factor n=1 Tax=Microaerobacter geothermalis TaxID=674972 RepID=UPI001F411F83|nr:response regulator transcription factor [Microaerobacter geothermalis]MCF6093071.1 response regulator transcription factor [Microaerobacter geothermalis]
MKGKILVIDDDQKITAMLKRALTYEGYQVETALSGKEGLHMALHSKPDLVILDIMMPGLDGWEVCQRLRAESDVPVMMLTAKDEIKDRVKGLDLGADDYIVKPFSLEELTARVRALLRRNTQHEEENRKLVFEDLTILPDSREVWRNGRAISLTAKEYELLYLFVKHPKKVLTKDYLMEQVWGFDFSGESNVLEVYIALLRQKLEEQGEKRLIKTVRGVGYVLRSED